MRGSLPLTDLWKSTLLSSPTTTCRRDGDLRGLSRAGTSDSPEHKLEHPGRAERAPLVCVMRQRIPSMRAQGRGQTCLRANSGRRSCRLARPGSRPRGEPGSRRPAAPPSGPCGTPRSTPAGHASASRKRLCPWTRSPGTRVFTRTLARLPAHPRTSTHMRVSRGTHCLSTTALLTALAAHTRVSLAHTRVSLGTRARSSALRTRACAVLAQRASQRPPCCLRGVLAQGPEAL